MREGVVQDGREVEVRRAPGVLGRRRRDGRLRTSRSASRARPARVGEGKMVQVSKSIFRWGGVGGVKGRPHHLLGHTALDDLGDLGRVA